MLALLQKEISGFFSSLTGYIVILVFLCINGMFMWVFPGQLNILDSAYASLEPLFYMAPWVFLFLIPAITMRMFSEEKKTGTIETLLTKPLSDLQIIMAKYLSAIVMVALALLPCFIYFLSVYQLGNPVGNLDIAGTMGSMIGLFLLAAVYSAVGIWASAITDNQIVAFILAVAISFFMYTGFDSLANLFSLESFNDIIINLGINEHYQSMSRGVIDSRDLIYFFSVIGIFISFTRFIFQTRKW